MKEKFHPRAHQQPSKVTGCFQLAPVNYPKNQEWLPSKKNFLSRNMKEVSSNLYLGLI